MQKSQCVYKEPQTFVRLNYFVEGTVTSDAEQQKSQERDKKKHKHARAKGKENWKPATTLSVVSQLIFGLNIHCCVCACVVACACVFTYFNILRKSPRHLRLLVSVLAGWMT